MTKFSISYTKLRFLRIYYLILGTINAVIMLTLAVLGVFLGASLARNIFSIKTSVGAYLERYTTILFSICIPIVIILILLKAKERAMQTIIPTTTHASNENLHMAGIRHFTEKHQYLVFIFISATLLFVVTVLLSFMLFTIMYN